MIWIVYEYTKSGSRYAEKKRELVNLPRRGRRECDDGNVSRNLGLIIRVYVTRINELIRDHTVRWLGA